MGDDERTDECHRCGARWPKDDQPRGTVILSASEYRAEHEELLRLRAEVEKLRAVVGPPLECGCYAVEVVSLDTDEETRRTLWCNRHEGSVFPVTPEYLAWRKSRQKGGA